MGLRNNLERLDQRLHRKPSSSGSLPPWYDPLADRPSWVERHERQRRYYNGYNGHSAYYDDKPYPGGGIVPNPGVLAQYPAGSVSNLYNEGWLATSVPCSTCGNLMLEQHQQQIYWCSTCCQKFAREIVERSSRADTALEWLTKQIIKYTSKK